MSVVESGHVTGVVDRDRPSLRDVAVTELARMRRGFVGWYMLVAPIGMTVPLYLTAVNSPEGRSGRTFQVFRDVALEGWWIVFPMTAALIAALSVRADQDAWRLMFSYAVPRRLYLWGKLCALAAMTLFSTTVLAAFLAGGAALNGRLGDGIGTIVAATYLPWLAGLGLTALLLLVGVAWGLGPTIALGVTGMMSGMFVSDKSWWFAVPFAWPMRVVLPLAGVGPNGVPLRPDSPLRDPAPIVPAVALSLVLLAVVVVVGSIYMRRKEI